MGFRGRYLGLRGIRYGNWRRLHSEELHEFYPSPNIVQVLESKRMRWVGHVTCMGERRDWELVGKPEPRQRGHLGDLGLDGRISQ